MGQITRPHVQYALCSLSAFSTKMCVINRPLSLLQLMLYSRRLHRLSTEVWLIYVTYSIAGNILWLKTKELQWEFGKLIEHCRNMEKLFTKFIIRLSCVKIIAMSSIISSLHCVSLSTVYKAYDLGPVAPTSLNFKSYLSPDLRTTYGRLYGS